MKKVPWPAAPRLSASEEFAKIKINEIISNMENEATDLGSHDGHPSYKRKKFIVNESVQLAILLYSIFLTTGVVALGVVANKISIQELEGVPFTEPRQWIPALICFGVLVGLIIYGIRLTNKIAGPIERLKQHLEASADGKNAGELRFRKGDFFQEIIEPYNKVMNKK